MRTQKLNGRGHKPFAVISKTAAHNTLKSRLTPDRSEILLHNPK
jgi:hypothetical protein